MTWSDPRTLERYLQHAKRRRCTKSTHATLRNDLQKRQRGSGNPKGHKERLSGKPTAETIPWPKITDLTLDSSETNPEQDIVNARYAHCQIRVEGEKAHSYHRNGKYIGTLTTKKLLRLKERYAQAVGQGDEKTETQKRLTRELWREHSIHVETFEDEVASLLIRYSSKKEEKERKQNLQNHPELLAL